MSIYQDSLAAIDILCRMDQSASILSLPGNALYISFYPTLRPIAVPIPKFSTPAVFVIANSLASSHKAETGKTRYNLRVVETLVGAHILGKQLGLSLGKNDKPTYREILRRWWENQGKEDSEESLREEISAILSGEYLENLKGKKEEGLLLEEMLEMTQLSPTDFHQLFLSWVEGAFFSGISLV